MTQFRHTFEGMRVGIYVDAFNVYYGLKRLTKTLEISWKWLDVGKLA